jgi:branched-chain amino acid transport system ATP-binding protein
VLEVDDLHVRYGSIAALRGVSLAVREGELVALVGPNGAGKSTTLACIVGLVRPAGGTVRLDGKDLTRAAPEEIVRRGVSLVPEGRRIFTTLTVRENLVLGASARTGPVDVDAELRAMVARFPALEPKLATPAGRLSGGEQQMLAIARALLGRPRLLLLDEPSLGLAPLIVDQIFATLQELRSDGTTILLVEQNAARAVEVADRAYVLKSGELTIEGRGAELAARADLVAAYLGGPA